MLRWCRWISRCAVRLLNPYRFLSACFLLDRREDAIWQWCWWLWYAPPLSLLLLLLLLMVTYFALLFARAVLAAIVVVVVVVIIIITELQSAYSVWSSYAFLVVNPSMRKSELQCYEHPRSICLDVDSSAIWKISTCFFWLPFKSVTTSQCETAVKKDFAQKLPSIEITSLNWRRKNSAFELKRITIVINWLRRGSFVNECAKSEVLLIHQRLCKKKLNEPP